MSNLAAQFLEVAEAHPHRTALAFEAHEVSYRALAARVEALRLQLAGVATGACIGLLAQRSDTAYAGVLASLAEAHPYVPLNPGFPPIRNAFIAEKVRLDTLIVGAECVDALRALLGQTTANYRVVTLGCPSGFEAVTREFPARITWCIADVVDDVQPRAAKNCAPEALAYVLFTSGSTGVPKGVCVTHGNVASYLRNLLALYPVLPTDRLSQTFDLTFDLSVHDMFVCYAAGATLVVYPPAALASPIPYTRTHGVTVWFSVPALAAFLESTRQAEPGALPALRLSFFCGEKLSWNTLRIWRAVAPHTRIVNLYGPTEATIAITHFEVHADFREADALHGAIPIGRAFATQHAEVRRADGTQADVGEIGALWLAGDQLSRGYLDAPELTASRFVPSAGRLFYRTGDLARREVDGSLQFAGRDDCQVKIMGYRVELGEVEHALMQLSGCTLALADVAALRDDIEELYAVLPKAAEPRKAALRKALKQRLPAYMQPRTLLFMDDLPLNVNGKLDRAAVRARVLERTRE